MQLAPAPDAVIFVLLDAFRHDYLGRTRFLRSLAARSLVGRLEEPFGFCPRAAYFGGLTMAQQGFTNILRYDPERSVFGWTRHLHLDDGETPEAMRVEIIRRARAQLPEFGAACVDPLDVPLKWLGYFDVSEREAPWSRHVGYRSLFHLLDDVQRKWLQVSWPFPDVGSVANQGSVTAEALQRMDSAHAFTYIHLPTLDADGHRFGPGSVEVQREIEETDRLCELIAARALELHRDPVLLFAGDHGMLPVIRRADVASALLETKLRFGHDFAFFIDSTMVRCWFFTRAARETTVTALQATRSGRWLTDEDERRWELAGISPLNAHAIFLAHPGVLFAPSFFDWHGRATLKGMHGYAPEVADNQAVFLAHRPRATWAGEVGVVAAQRLFPTFLRWLGWDPVAFTSIPPVDELAAAPRTPRWTAVGSPQAEAMVDAQIIRCVAAVRNAAPQVSAIVLGGGFGRGEGTVHDEGTGSRVANDFDLIVVGADAGQLAGLGPKLAGELAMDFVDVAAVPNLTPPDQPTQAWFDLRYGARVLWGDPLALERLPLWAPSEIDPAEGIYLLANRLGGVLLALSEWEGPAGRRSETARHQISKLLIAVADSWLMTVRDYHPSYRTRRRRFAELATAAGFGKIADAIDQAYAFKIEGATATHYDVAPAAVLVSEAMRSLGQVLGHTPWPDALVQQIEAVVRTKITVPPDWRQRLASGGLSRKEGVSDPACAGAIYRACAVLALHWNSGGEARSAAAVDQLATAFKCKSLSPPELPRKVAAAWLALFH